MMSGRISSQNNTPIPISSLRYVPHGNQSVVAMYLMGVPVGARTQDRMGNGDDLIWYMIDADDSSK